MHLQCIFSKTVRANVLNQTGSGANSYAAVKFTKCKPRKGQVNKLWKQRTARKPRKSWTTRKRMKSTKTVNNTKKQENHENREHHEICAGKQNPRKNMKMQKYVSKIRTPRKAWKTWTRENRENVKTWKPWKPWKRETSTLFTRKRESQPFSRVKTHLAVENGYGRGNTKTRSWAIWTRFLDPNGPLGLDRGCNSRS